MACYSRVTLSAFASIGRSIEQMRPLISSAGEESAANALKLALSAGRMSRLAETASSLAHEDSLLGHELLAQFDTAIGNLNTAARQGTIGVEHLDAVQSVTGQAVRELTQRVASSAAHTHPHTHGEHTSELVASLTQMLGEHSH